MSAATMRAWQLPAGCTSAEQLELLELPRPDPAPGEVRVRVRATSLNFRDQAIARGHYFGGAIKVAGVPLSDGAGVVDAVGAGVSDTRGRGPGRRQLLPGLAYGAADAGAGCSARLSARSGDARRLRDAAGDGRREARQLA